MHDLVEAFVNSLQGYLLEQLQIGTPGAAERFKDLLAEDEAIAQTRMELQQRRSNIEEIKVKLDSYKF